MLVAPAVNEGFGRTLVEAILCGTPVIAADHGGHREIITHAKIGILVPADDAEAFAEAVSRLLNTPSDGCVVADEARSSAAARYSVTAHVEQIQSIYASLDQR